MKVLTDKVFILYI